MNPKSRDQNPKKYKWQTEKGKLQISNFKIENIDPLHFSFCLGTE